MNYFDNAHAHGRILVATATPQLQRNFREALELEGYEVLVADDGRDALRTFRTHAPKAIVLDLAMPFHRDACNRDGTAPLEVLTDVDPFLPILLVADEEESIDHPTALMADMILRLPVSSAELTDGIDTLLHESMRQRSQRKSAQLASLQ